MKKLLSIGAAFLTSLVWGSSSVAAHAEATPAPTPVPTPVNTLSPIYEATNPTTSASFISSVQNEVKSASQYGFSSFSGSPAFLAYRVPSEGLNAVDRLYSPTLGFAYAVDGSSEYTKDVKTLGYSKQKIEFYAATSPNASLGLTAPVYGIKNASNSMFYTTDSGIKGLDQKKPGWSQGTVAFYVAPNPQLGSKSTCLLNDGTSCPDSYFTGPLGSNELLPKGTGGFLIDYYGGIGVDWASKQKGILDREKSLGRSFDSIQIMDNPDPTSDNNGHEQWVLSTGHKFVTVAWNPTYDLNSIIDGSQDALLTKAALYWKSINAPVMLRMLTEFNLNSSIVTGGGCGTKFQQAWQHIITLFQKNGASNVGFWFNPEEGNNRQCIIDSYPGDNYVDWVGSDSYNWCSVGDDSCWSSAEYSGAAKFDALFNYGGACPTNTGKCPASQYSLFGSRKPFVVGETGTVSDSTAAQFKPAFLKSIADDSPALRYLKGVSLYDQDVTSAEGSKTNFRIDYPYGNSAVAEADKYLASASFFNTESR